MIWTDKMEKEYQEKIDHETHIYYKRVHRCIEQQNQLYKIYRIRTERIKQEIKNKE